MSTFEQHEAKHQGLPPSLFTQCPSCFRLSAWDVRRKRCTSCEYHEPTRASAIDPQSLIVVTVQVPTHSLGTATSATFARGLLAAYGGYSRHNVTGAWRNDSRRTVNEIMTVFEIAMKPGQVDIFRRFRVEQIRLAFNQSVLYYTIAGQAYLHRG